MRYCLTKMAEASDEAIRGTFSETKALADAPSSGLAMLGSLLMECGTELEDPALTNAGVRLMSHFAEKMHIVDGIPMARYMRLFWSETLLPVPGLLWLGRLTGERRYSDWAATIIRAVVERNQRSDGLWWHWTDGRGGRGAPWSRGVFWSVECLAHGLFAGGADMSGGEMARQAIMRTYEGLGQHADAKRGIWHLVVDEPETRVETSGSVGLVCYDAWLRDRDVLAGEPSAFVPRAFDGLKRLHYGGGLAASCRGTATGVDDYYRTRPMGFYDMGMWGGALASRCATAAWPARTSNSSPSPWRSTSSASWPGSMPSLGHRHARRVG